MDSGVAAVKIAQRHRPGPLRILLVDADERFRVRLARRLAQQGHQVSSFSNCNDAWRLARRNAFDVTLVDLEVPAMTSLELVRRIKARKKRALIIATSPNFTPNSLWAERMCQTHGINHMLGKDDGIRQLYTGIDQLIGSNRPDGAVSG